VGGAAAATLPPGPTTSVLAPTPVDPYSSYVAQSTCDPVAKPGARAVLKLAMDHYKVGRNSGIIRSCSIGAGSEHKEGRAFDWGLDVNDPAEKAAGDAFTEWLTAPGPDGKPGYNARRLGVMYVIWNRKVWYASSPTTGWRDYFGASPHTDHVHVSLSWNGAYMRTSWWTGSLVAQAPIGAVDAVATTDRDLTVHGWALDPDTSSSTDVHVYVDGVGVSARADRYRGDIAAAYGRGPNHGFAVTVPQRPGPHTLCTYAIDLDPIGNTPLGCTTVVVKDSSPLGSVDAITTTSSSITFNGWSLDPDTTDPNDVHVYVDGVGVAVRADRPRPDLGVIFGRGDRHGFSYTAKAGVGRHDVCVYGINTGSGANTMLTCRSVVVDPPPTAAPFGVLDSVTVSPTGVTVAGWTIDPDTNNPTEVHVYVDGVVTVVRADRSRPDVAAVHGKGDRHGFSHTKQLSPGPHSVCVHAINTAVGPHALLGCRNFTVVADAAPFGVVDTLRAGGGALSVTGWALDPDTVDPIDVHVYVDGVGVSVRADQSRPDVAAAFGRGDRHGFTHNRPLAPGRHDVCVYAFQGPGIGTRQLVCTTGQAS
jgi:hypothetical protein